MTALQQSFSQQSVLQGQSVYRLYQQLASGGDIFEIDSSALVFALGPQSDVSDLLLTYFDPQTANRINQINISAKTPFIGRLDSRLSTDIPSAGTKARIQVSVRDLVNNTWLPRTFAGGSDFVAARVAPSIDLLQYLSPPDALAPARDDRQYFFPFVSTVPNASAWFILPYYGRTYGHCNFVNMNQATAVIYDVTVWGITFSAGTTSTGGLGKQGETQIGTFQVLQNQTGNLIFSECEGMYDMLAVEVHGDVGIFDPDATLRVIVRDV